MPGVMTQRDLMAGVANGVVRVDDWVRELPATYLRFDGEQRYPAEEFERVQPPGTGTDPVVIGSDPAANAALLRDPETLTRVRSLLREAGGLNRGWHEATSDRGETLPERLPETF
jgi:hypothetical protein